MNTTQATVGDIVREDFRAAAVFEHHGIDFCCGGGDSLSEACAARGVSPAELLAELEAIRAAGSGVAGDFYERMSLPLLIEHILETHHGYLRRTMPPLTAWSAKVASAHGERHPETVRLAAVVAALCAELEQHMFKEERILFPAIVAQSEVRADRPPFGFGSIGNPIAMMEHEHRDAGAALEELRTISGGFAVPSDACATYTALYRELEVFEKDLHMHIHLENNILFPRALRNEAGA